MSWTRREPARAAADDTQPELIIRASSVAQAASNRPGTQYVCEKNRSLSTAFFGFTAFPPELPPTGIWSHSSFGETQIDRKDFVCLRNVRDNAAATVNAAFLMTFSSLWANDCFQEEIKKAMNEQKRVVLTGHSVGGATAILVTVKLLEDTLRVKETPAFVKCITFGSPLVGDFIFGHALRREGWATKFEHFVNKYDLIPRITFVPRPSLESILPQVHKLMLTSSTGCSSLTIDEASSLLDVVMKHLSQVASHDACQLMGNTNQVLETAAKFLQLCPYRPFGVYMFSSGDGRFFRLTNQDAILQVLYYTLQTRDEIEKSVDVPRKIFNAHQQCFQALKGDFHVIPLEHRDLVPIPRGLSMDALNELGMSPRATLCIMAAVEAENRKAKNKIRIEGKKVEISASLKRVEDYKRRCEDRKIEYYDDFKNSSEKDDDFLAGLERMKLAGIWDEIYEMLRKYELPDDFNVSPDWILLGTQFRRLVEPLDIANYYKYLKNEDTGPYMDRGRPSRYKLTQLWLEYDQEKSSGVCADFSFLNEFLDQVRRVNGVVSVENIQGMIKISGARTESCFWAEVEELMAKHPLDEIMRFRLLVLEAMLKKWKNEGRIERDFFLHESSFSRWWNTELPEEHRQESLLREELRSKN